jgi:hypothetical protein
MRGFFEPRSVSWNAERVFGVLLLLGASSCERGGDASCVMRQEVDAHSIHSCTEFKDLDSDEFEEARTDCESIAGRDSYVESSFHERLCSRKNIVGGCDLGDGIVVWYFPNSEGYPSPDDMPVVCSFRGLDEVPPP